MDFNQIWLNILAHQKESFFTVRKCPFTYTVKNDRVIVKVGSSGNEYPISKKFFEMALFVANPKPSNLRKNGVDCFPAYISSIIIDERIRKI